jgi:hypothetical protein
LTRLTYVVEHFAAIIARVEAGESVRRICDDLGMPTRNEFRWAIAADRAMRDRYDQAKVIWAKNRPAFYRAVVKQTRARFYSVTGKRLQHAEEIIRLVATGMSLHAACRSQPYFPSPGQMRGQFRRDSELERKYLAASKHLRAPPQPVTTPIVDTVIAKVASGKLLRDACADVGIKVSAFQFRALNDPAQRAQWLAAKEKGNEARLARGTLRHADAILALIEEHGMTVKTALASNPDYPSPSTFRNALDTHAALRARYDSAVARQTVNRFIATRSAMPAPALIRSNITVILPGERLAASLSSNHLWRVAIASLPTNLDPDMRNDVAADIVVAVLSGDLSPHQIASEANRFIRAHNKKFSQFEFASLDKSVSIDSTFTLGDTLTSW